MSSVAPLTLADTRITIRRRTPRWTVDEEVSVRDAMDFWAFAAGAANVVMQLSWPQVGHGVVESPVDSGNLLIHPWKRARTTFAYLAVAVFGTPEDRAAYRAAVDTAHRHVRSTPASPVRYNAFDRDVQMWVAACLFVGLEDTYQLLRGELTPTQAEQFYASAHTLGTTLQVREEQWPPTRADFDDYWLTACAKVHVDDVVRRYLHDLLDLKMVNVALRVPFRPLLRFLTTGFLAPVFREPLGLPWSPARQRRFEALFRFVALVNRFLPGFVRQGGNYVLLADVRRRVRRNRRLI
ncbi:oxygenase MpaB family protein [Mycobacterium sp. MYCO198283]|uniref:oxygenase MpaB family protein n=1 Tax=Mycobacterium sp. MYCO198283 TaxID=2883505 RepID=UPI001E645886|nr:oxygenase MpaB family protein [Mycobacterium sp. MYCO198283]MCG5432270.1 oxygenase MpaB family protein [Mycobacterium sp. MYCO198283]